MMHAHVHVAGRTQPARLSRIMACTHTASPTLSRCYLFTPTHPIRTDRLKILLRELVDERQYDTKSWFLFFLKRFSNVFVFCVVFYCMMYGMILVVSWYHMCKYHHAIPSKYRSLRGHLLFSVRGQLNPCWVLNTRCLLGLPPISCACDGLLPLHDCRGDNSATLCCMQRYCDRTAVYSSARLFDVPVFCCRFFFVSQRRPRGCG